ncbi:CaiB/BaiF CoA transferase family protein [Pseudonocardia sp. CA-107938]|uniref:CaiB/BaiF CoA transferase family protein n=1 Tax=Pseudonocardia sp. CA-107938 TaxID=3240021 RepID=UPI003D929B8E
MAHPLDGVRVIDLGHHVAGPLAATMLADQGADVVHIDRPGAAPGPSDAFYQRGKRRLTLDLHDAADLAVARRLCERADVVVENFRPGVLERLGLGHGQLDAPRLVHLSLPGFGADDPRHDLPGWECVIDAATGNCRLRAGEAPDGWDPARPTYSAVPAASNIAAFLGVVGVVAALVERERSGRGQHVTVPLADAVFELIGDAGAFPTAQGMPVPRPLAMHGSGTYACADGRYVQFNPIGASRRFLGWLLDAAGRPEWAAITDDGELRTHLTALFASRPAAEWAELGARAGVPLAPVRTAAEWLATPEAITSGALARLDDPLLGPTTMAGAAVEVVGSPPPLRPRRLPDADHAAVVAELVTAPAGPAPREGERDRPLAGLRVLDLTQILAGPSSGRLLGELGAHVTKINAPQRRIHAHGAVNRGKDTILLDVEHPAGQAVFWALAEQADVIIANFPPGTAERYGIGAAHVRARCPHVVHVSVSCYGTEGRGYETQAQACTGITTRAGGDGRPAVLGPYNVLDYGTGVLAAYAAVLGVLHRERTGEGLALATSLVRTASQHQAGLFFQPGAEPAGPEALGEHPLHRFHRASDGWFALGATPTDLPRLAEVPGLREVAGHTDQDKLAAVLEDLFARRPVAEWERDLQAAGIGAHRVVELAELMADDTARARGLVVTQVSEEVGEVTAPGITIGMSATPLAVGAPARRPGSDARRVLDRIGMGDALPDLERAWAVQTTGLPDGWPAPTSRPGATA